MILQVYRGKRGLMRRTQWRARLKDGSNGNILFVTSEGYNNLNDLLAVCAKAFPTLTPELYT